MKTEKSIHFLGLSVYALTLLFLTYILFIMPINVVRKSTYRIVDNDLYEIEVTPSINKLSTRINNLKVIINDESILSKPDFLSVKKKLHPAKSTWLLHFPNRQKSKLKKTGSITIVSTIGLWQIFRVQ